MIEQLLLAAAIFLIVLAAHFLGRWIAPDIKREDRPS